MPDKGFDIPVLLIIFKRPELTKNLFEQIRKIKPQKLYVTADGPRDEEERKLTEQTRELIKVDWDCDVHLFFHEQNLGVARNPVFGINKLFEENEYGIILEDDINPTLSFFKYIRELLIRYKDDPEIGYITGMNPFPLNIPYSYTFTYFAYTLGWGTWKRVWQDYDFEIKKWGQVDKIEWLKERFQNPLVRLHWYDFFNRTYGGSDNAWDYQLRFLTFDKKQKVIVPQKSLTAHLGIDPHATHKDILYGYKYMTHTYDIEFPLKHPVEKTPDYKLESKFYERHRRLMLFKLFTRPYKYLPWFLKLL